MDNKKSKAFVIQSFDGGKFDRRYQETIKPGIVKGGANPERADQILGLQPIIEKIESAIKSAEICVAEVSTDNPNVWLELGYALALNRPTIILCDKNLRERLPFDIQHRPVIFYNTESKSGYDDLEGKIATTITHLIETSKAEKNQPVLRSGAEDIGELKGHEISILASLLTFWSVAPNGSSKWEIERSLSKTNYSETQIAIGLTSLLAKGYIEQDAEEDRDGSDFFVYRITPNGIRWIHENENSIEPLMKKPEAKKGNAVDFSDDDTPF